MNQVLPPKPSQRVGDPTGSGTGYPWQTGNQLYAADLNYAFENAVHISTGALQTSGGTMTGPLTLAGNATAPLQAVPLQQMHIVSVLDYGAKGDGVTDDTAAIQAVLNAQAGKAVVFVPDTGHSYIANTLTVPTGTDMLIDGSMLLKAGATSHLLYVNAASNVTIRGHGTLDGNNPTNSYPAASGGTLFIINSTNVQVTGLTIQNAPLWPLVAQSSSRVLLNGVNLVGGRNASGFSVNCDECWLTNSVVNGPSADIGFAFYSGITNSGAIGNTVKNSGGNTFSAVGITVLADSTQGAACSNIVISNNVITNCGGSGIGIFSATANHHDGIVISGNRCYGNGRRPAGNRADIDINGATDVLVIGNQSANFGSNADPWWGMDAWNCSGVAYIGNQIYNVGYGGGGTSGTGLYINGMGGILASGNIFYDNNPTPTMTASIGGTAGAVSVFVGNNCGKPNTLTMASDTVFSNAVGGATQMLVNANGEAPLWIGGPAGTNRMPVFTTTSGTSNVARWYFGVDNTAESGSNAGSNFQILSCNDAGAAVHTPLSINRATSATTVAGPLLYTATGGTVARAAQDRVAALANVLDFGAVGDGTTDNTAAFNAAIATGKVVYVPMGTYVVQPLTLTQGMIGDGMGVTIIRAAASMPAGSTLITQNAASDATMRDLTIDGRNLATYGVGASSTITQQTGLRFVRLEVTNIGNSSSTASPLPGGIFWYCNTVGSKQAIVVTECYIHDVYGDGIHADGTGNVVSNNTLVNIGSAGIAYDLALDGVISNNTIKNTGSNPNLAADGITGYSQNNLRMLVTGNTIDTGGNNGIHIGGNNNQIIGNKIYNVQGNGILLQSAPNTGPTPSFTGLIANNEVDTAQAGIRCGWFSRVSVTGNTVSNLPTGSAGAAIFFASSSDCICTGNVVYNIGNDGIQANTSLNLIINGNRISTVTGRGINDIGNASTGIMAYGNTITGEGTATVPAFGGTVAIRANATVGGATTLGDTTMVPVTNNWGGNQVVKVGTTTGGNTGMMFLSADTTTPALGFYRYASGLYFSYGTGTAYSNDVAILSAGSFRVLQQFRVDGSALFTVPISFVAGPTINSGTGAPTGTQPNGSIWQRSDGTTGARLYVSTGSAWTPVAGV